MAAAEPRTGIVSERLVRLCALNQFEHEPAMVVLLLADFYHLPVNAGITLRSRHRPPDGQRYPVVDDGPWLVAMPESSHIELLRIPGSVADLDALLRDLRLVLLNQHMGTGVPLGTHLIDAARVDAQRFTPLQLHWINEALGLPVDAVGVVRAHALWLRQPEGRRSGTLDGQTALDVVVWLAKNRTTDELLQFVKSYWNLHAKPLGWSPRDATRAGPPNVEATHPSGLVTMLGGPDGTLEAIGDADQLPTTPAAAEQYVDAVRWSYQYFEEHRTTGTNR